MRRLLGLKDSAHSSNPKGKERQQDSAAAISSPTLSSFNMPLEVHVRTEVHSAADRQTFHPLASATTIESSSSTSSGSRPPPPEIRVPTHPYPYWQGYTHTPSSSQSSLESPATPPHVSWLGLANIPGNTNAASNGSRINLSLPSVLSIPQASGEPGSSIHSFIQGRSSPSPHFPPPPPTNPPPNIAARPKLLHPTKSSHSLRVPVQEFYNQQLSPIVEQDYISPEKRPSSLPSSSHEGGGSRSSTAHTARTSGVLITPVSPSDGFGTGTVTPVTPVPITPVLVSARGAPSTSQMLPQTPVTPSYLGAVVPFARRRDEEGNDSPRGCSSCLSSSSSDPNRLTLVEGPSPVSTFILRPLNRSISQSSTRTHQSGASSVTPPVIPPLDLKPEFKGQAFLTTPTSLHSRGLLDVCARDDDSVSDRRESFVTARTGQGRESRYSLGQDEVFVDAEEGFIRDSDGTIHPFDSRLLDDASNTPPTPKQSTPQSISKPVKPPIPARTTMHPYSSSGAVSLPPCYNYPSTSQSSDNHLHRLPAAHPSRLGVSAPSLQELGASTSASSSFIDRRFAASSLYLTPPSERESARKAGNRWRLERVDTVRVLFWLGFVMPWCWLFGGWLVSPKSPLHGQNLELGQSTGSRKGLESGRTNFVPLVANRNKSVYSLDTVKMHHGYPFVAPSVLSLTPPPPPYQSHRTVVLTPKPVEWERRETVNPYVRRCRIAAVTSGILVTIALLVTLIMIGVRYGYGS